MPTHMPRGPRTTDARSVRKKVQLSLPQAARLAAEAQASARTESGYLLELLLAHWDKADRRRGLPMPAPSFVRNSKLVIHARADLRRRVLFAAAELDGLKRSAAAAGLTEAQFIHHSVIAAIGFVPLAPKTKPGRNSDRLIGEVQALVWQLAKHGANLNQLAHQANTGMVAVKAAEMHYAITQQQLLYSKVAATLERLIA